MEVSLTMRHVKNPQSNPDRASCLGSHFDGFLNPGFWRWWGPSSSLQAPHRLPPLTLEGRPR